MIVSQPSRNGRRLECNQKIAVQKSVDRPMKKTSVLLVAFVVAAPLTRGDDASKPAPVPVYYVLEGIKRGS